MTRRVSRAISVRIADELFTIFLELFMAIQVMLVYFIPVVGPVLSFFLMSWLYALYCFEYVVRPQPRWGSPCKVTWTPRAFADTSGLISDGLWIAAWTSLSASGLTSQVLVCSIHRIARRNTPYRSADASLNACAGLPFTCCTFFFPQFVNGGVFAMLFPPFIIMATGYVTRHLGRV